MLPIPETITLAVYPSAEFGWHVPERSEGRGRVARHACHALRYAQGRATQRHASGRVLASWSKRLACLIVLISLYRTLPAAEPLKPVNPPAEAPFAEDPIPTDPDELRAKLTQWIARLDSDQYYQRQQAMGRLQEVAGKPDSAAILAEEVGRVLVAEGTSFEIRKQLAVLSHSLPKSVSPPVADVSPTEIDRLIDQLEADSFAQRAAANARLQWLAGNPRLVCPLIVRIKQRMAQPRRSVDSPQWLTTIYDRARGAWLTSDPAAWEFPPVPDEQIVRWTQELARSLGSEAASRQRQSLVTAQRELQDLLARDEYVAKVKASLEAELARQPGSDAAGRLQGLLNLTRPAMAVEYWEGGKQAGLQQLVVGVPSKDPSALRPSHFDRVDDQTAHCVSGNNLSPGDYPVGVAIPHPARQGALFHLVNLPTPLRQMAYAYQVQLDMDRRLVELSRRTLDRILDENRAMTRAEIIMSEQLDADVLSSFAGRYFNQIDDQAQDSSAPPAYSPYRSGVYGPILALHRAAETASRHNMLASLLARVGNHHAIPGLLEALKSDRFLAPTAEAPARLGWVGALAIARRDPCPDVDRWLAGLLDRDETLLLPDNSPQLAATAAGLLLVRHKQAPAQYGLETAAGDVLTEAGVPGYRFKSPDSREKIRQWSK
jgi:hypothetical protein